MVTQSIYYYSHSHIFLFIVTWWLRVYVILCHIYVPVPEFTITLSCSQKFNTSNVVCRLYYWRRLSETNFEFGKITWPTFHLDVPVIIKHRQSDISNSSWYQVPLRNLCMSQLRSHCITVSTVNIQQYLTAGFRSHEAKIEEREKAGSC